MMNGQDKILRKYKTQQLVINITNYIGPTIVTYWAKENWPFIQRASLVELWCSGMP